MPHGQANVKAKTQDLVERTLELLEDGRKKIKYYDSNEYVMIIGKAGTGEHISHKEKISTTCTSFFSYTMVSAWLKNIERVQLQYTLLYSVTST
jgi:tRNA(His) 5'-end guanylyltransferase